MATRRNFEQEINSLQRQQSSRSDSRKAASALIAEIPFTLAEWIARCFTPSA
jgi:hypothetical protein